MRNAGRRKKRRTGISFIAVIAVLICGVLLYSTSTVKEDLHDAQAKYEKLEKRYENALDEEKALDAEKKYRQTDKYIEDLARNNLGMVYPDEILIVPSEEGE